jgi:hypothetical protein
MTRNVAYSFSCSDDAKLEGESNNSKWKVTEIRTVNGYCGNLSHSADSFLAIPKQFLPSSTLQLSYEYLLIWDTASE